MHCACAVFSSVTFPDLRYFSAFSKKCHDFGKRKDTEHKICVLISSTFFVWNISHSKKKWTSFHSKTNQMHQCIKFILEWHSTCFGRSFRPSSGVQDCTYSNKQDTAVCWLASRQQYLFDKCLLLYVQSWSPDDGRKDRPKHVECHSKINLIHWCIWLVLL